jgi:outer membrane protein assembly factor BamD (BamD/ComL family)
MERSMRYVKSAQNESAFSARHSEVITQSLDQLYAMARRYLGEGNPRQAMEIYWTLSEGHPTTPQGQSAQDGLLELAAIFGSDGSRHQARAIYERLSD